MKLWLGDKVTWVESWRRIDQPQIGTIVSVPDQIGLTKVLWSNGQESIAHESELKLAEDSASAAIELEPLREPSDD